MLFRIRILYIRLIYYSRTSNQYRIEYEGKELLGLIPLNKSIKLEVKIRIR
jgi:hypothetical protein